MSIFEQETRVVREREDVWRAQLVPGWRIGDVPCGGYPLAIAARALSEALSHPDPLSVHIRYISPTEIGPAKLIVEKLSEGKNTSHGILKMYQNGEIKTVVTASYTDLQALKGENWKNSERPKIPSYEDCTPVKEHGIELRSRVNQCYATGGEIFRRQEPNGSGCFNGWLSFTDESAIDTFGALMLADAFSPPILTVYGVQGWVPTIDLSVQLRATPCPGPLQVRFTTRYLTDGVMEEDGELWDCSGSLVALSRQVGKLRLIR